MDTSLNLSNSAVTAAQPSPVSDRAATTRVAPIDASDTATTRPSEKPFMAQVVSARLSGAQYPENPVEIAPPDRTLRPYDVPMLPSRDDVAEPDNAAGDGAKTSAPPD